jgi:predicted Holliday junction resolvase-like endonuclease
MIGIIIVIMIIGITLIIQAIREWNRNINQIRELEQRLEQYYKEREERLNKKMRNIETHRKGIDNKEEKGDIEFMYKWIRKHSNK